jgi:glucosamine--fructose-6-phosphate aminotransferase (isomerizing)
MFSRDEAVEAKTQNEILSQPGCWEECFSALDESAQLEQAAKWDAADAEHVFVGCGSSYYISQAAAASWGLITGRRAWAVPASEVLLYSDLVLNGPAKCQPVLVSRSGQSSEVVRAAQYLEQTKNLRTLAISCSEGHPLEEICAFTIHLLPADEQSVVMTRSFTSMLLGLQSLAAYVACRKDITRGLRQLPPAVKPILDSVNPRIQEFVKAKAFSDYVFLGQGPFFGIASEGQLKIKEMSCSYAQVFHTLEFRHGPKAIVGPETLITFLLSETGYAAEREVLEEMKELGGTTLVIANQADAVVRRNADFLVELKLDVPECARLAAYLVTCQLLGLYTGLKKGYDIDRPRNLSRAVILNR